MNIDQLVLQNRSYRRFYQDERIERVRLAGLVNLARLSASGSNKQALKFVIVNEPPVCDKVFPSTVWAGYLKDWDGPEKGEQPSAYIIILGDTQISKSFGVDHGIAAQSILLGASEQGLGGCMIGSIKREQLGDDLKIALRYEILLIVALGKPKEMVVIDEAKDGDIRYWRDEKGVHHVPKRSLEELILEL
ncbi:MAG: nitroreductase family protein [Bacteroidales bacterium]|nr:nitroreductase family protein [Bacteroidales bacterium]